MDLTAPAPDEIRVATDRGTITLLWPGETPASIGAAALRTACRCAPCVRDRETGAARPIAADIRIAAVQPVSHYAVNVSFTDGHDRGIYPWAYLRELAART
jgi:DUF971 family protein